VTRLRASPSSLPIGLAVATSLLLAAAVNAQEAGALTGGAEPDRVVLITGSTGGLGRELAYRIARTGAHVIVHGRDVERGEEVVARISDEGRGSARFIRADLASLAEVRELAETILAEYGRLDLLVNNAGLGPFLAEERLLSEDGYELRFAVNYLSHFVLTRLLLPRLRESAPSRIINVSSIGQASIDFDDPMMEEGYSGWQAYGQSKLAQIMFTFDLAEELEGTGVSVFALHPATYMDTDMLLEAGVTPRSSVDDGADAVMRLVTESGLESGQFFDGTRPARADAQAYDADARARLRVLSERLTGGS
jgi:NAD(P)-dependent dehydrogenase (short-subunit alcohol dehydrogenase family)